MNRIFTVILLAAAIASLVSTGFSLKKVSSMEDEINKLKAEKVELLSEHEECLAYKEKSLRKELVTKYLDSIMLLLNNMEKGSACPPVSPARAGAPCASPRSAAPRR